MSGARLAPSCTCTAWCGDCPGVRKSTHRPCDAFIASEDQHRLERAAPGLLALARQVAHLNPDAERIGPGMLAQLVTQARRLMVEATGSAT